jgi:hypothetical protein
MKDASEDQYASKGQCASPMRTQNRSRFRPWRSVRQGNLSVTSLYKHPICIQSIYAI